jgi:hypothetical protein
MNKRALAIGLIFVSGVADAHHSRANFDNSVTTVLSGTVVDYSWRNPHVYMELAVEDNGESKTWLVEAHSVTSMRRNGWDKQTLNVGEQITLTGSPDRDSSKNFILLNYVEKTDGSKLYAFRNPDAKPVVEKIEPSKDFAGTWNLDMSRFNARLAGGGPPETWDYTALALQEAEGFNVNQNPELQCLPIGVPRITIYPYGINIVRNDDRMLIHKEHMDEKRVVWFDSDKAALNNPAPSYVGTSVGRFESERHLVIETANFLPTRWGNANGVDSSAEKTVVEDYVLADDGMSIEISITITDPVYMNKPAVVTGGYIKDYNRDFVETPCDPEAASRHLSVE